MVGGLVEQQHVGRLGERSANLPALALAGRERRPARDRRGIEGEPPTDPRRVAGALVRQPVDRLVRRLDGLRADEHACALGLHDDAAAVRAQRAGEEAEQGGLARAVGADEPVPARAEMEIDAIEQRRRVAIRERQAAGLQSQHEHTPDPWRTRRRWASKGLDSGALGHGGAAGGRDDVVTRADATASLHSAGARVNARKSSDAIACWHQGRKRTASPRTYRLPPPRSTLASPAWPGLRSGLLGGLP